MNILITICGRGGSKGIPGKNIKSLNDKPLIWYTIESAKKFSKIYSSQISISTDSLEILKIAEEFGLFSEYIRPADLALDSSGKLDCIEDLLLYEEKKRKIIYDVILDLDISSPLRSVEDLVNAFNLFLKDDNALNLFSVSKANRNPYFNMVEIQDNGYYNLIKKGHFLTRQSCPNVFDLNASFYFYRRTFFEKKPLKVMSDYALVYEIKHICFDLDHNIDFEFMEFLLSQNKLDFEL